MHMPKQRILGQLAAMEAKRSEAEQSHETSKAQLKELRRAYNSRTLSRAVFERAWDDAVSSMDAAEQELRRLDGRTQDLLAQLQRTTAGRFAKSNE